MRVNRVAVTLGAGALALIANVNGPLAQMSEMDAFDKAVASGSKEDALAFIDEFGSSHLVPDLIDLLPPDVAAAVCADLSENTACNNLQNNLATAPAAGTTRELATTVEGDDEPPEDVGLPHDGPRDQGDTSGGSSSGGSTSSSTGGVNSSGGSSSGGGSGDLGGIGGDLGSIGGDLGGIGP